MTAATAPIYELWDVETGNLIADYEDETAALADIREGLNEEGLAAFATVALIRVEPGGERLRIAQGAALATRALSGQDSKVRVGETLLDAAQVQQAVLLIEVLTSEEFRQAIIGLRDALVKAFAEPTGSLDRIVSAASVVSETSGVPLRVDTEGGGLALITPNKTLAGLLAIGAYVNPTRTEVPIRSVLDGYAVDIAA